jgi:hypothetical protein
MGQPLADCGFNLAALHPADPIKRRTRARRERRHRQSVAERIGDPSLAAFDLTQALASGKLHCQWRRVKTGWKRELTPTVWWADWEFCYLGDLAFADGGGETQGSRRRALCAFSFGSRTSISSGRHCRQIPPTRAESRPATRKGASPQAGETGGL